MKKISPILIIAAFISLILCSGCLNQQPVPPTPTQSMTGTATPASLVTSVPATTLQPAVPSVIQTAQQTTPDPFPQKVTNLPPSIAVDIGIIKDRVYNTITVTFIGGPGQVLVKNILVRVTTPDGVVEQKNIPVGNQVSTGASVDMKGTRGSDRVEVFVTIGGVMYKLRDENLSYAYY